MFHEKNVPSHLKERPCFKCGQATKALRAGEIQRHPVCAGCSKEMAEQFALAKQQRDNQWVAEQRRRRAQYEVR